MLQEARELLPEEISAFAKLWVPKHCSMLVVDSDWGTNMGLFCGKRDQDAFERDATKMADKLNKSFKWPLSNRSQAEKFNETLQDKWSKVVDKYDDNVLMMTGSNMFVLKIDDGGVSFNKVL